MRILILHPEDSPRRGPWASLKWDLLVDLGKNSESAALEWEERFGCRVLRSDVVRQGISDLEVIKQILRMGRDRLLDSEGLDWWELTGLLLQADLEYALLLQRLGPEMSGDHEIYASRPGWLAEALAAVLNCELRVFCKDRGARFAMRMGHYGHLLRNMSWPQLSEIAFDKYDAEYKFRCNLARATSRANGPVVLVPTAYTNVSRVAAAYAGMLPDQQFLFIATRRSATEFEAPANVRLANLASYAPHRQSRQELSALVENWKALLAELGNIPAVTLLRHSGRLDSFPTLFRQGLAVRDHWRDVLNRELVTAVLCGDDSNRYTRIPVLLAKKRGLTTIGFHHGALDGRFLLKTLPSDLYLAKSEMESDYLIRVCGIPAEKIVLGAPKLEVSCNRLSANSKPPSQIVLFSEPYESAGARAEEIYRELVPPLARLARQSALKLIIKLHPFESRAQRQRLVKTILNREELSVIRILDSPISPALLLETWFGVTMESSTVLDCASKGVPCFLCRWLTLSSYGYVEQYARFGVGFPLDSSDQIPSIPLMLAKTHNSPVRQQNMYQPIEPNLLRRYLAGMGTMVDEREEHRPAIAAI